MRASVIVFSLLPVACGSAPATQPSTPIEAEPAPAPAASEPAPAGAASAPAQNCQDNHIWDATAKACRLFPGGGNGWAGCSVAKAPPGNEQCVTGTHWDSCDCNCDAPKSRWNEQAKRCEAAP